MQLGIYWFRLDPERFAWGGLDTPVVMSSAAKGVVAMSSRPAERTREDPNDNTHAASSWFSLGKHQKPTENAATLVTASARYRNLV